MPIDVPQCFRQVMQRVFIPALLVAARRQSAVCTRNLIQISIFLNKSKACQAKRMVNSSHDKSPLLMARITLGRLSIIKSKFFLSFSNSAIA